MAIPYRYEALIKNRAGGHYSPRARAVSAAAAGRVRVCVWKCRGVCVRLARTR